MSSAETNHLCAGEQPIYTALLVLWRGLVGPDGAPGADPARSRWYTVGRLARRITRANVEYEFVYLEEARQAREKSGFRGLFAMPLGVTRDERFESPELFFSFAIRNLSWRRPEFATVMRDLVLIGEDAAPGTARIELPAYRRPDEEVLRRIDPLAILMRSGGATRRDSFELIGWPERVAGRHGDQYRIHTMLRRTAECEPEDLRGLDQTVDTGQPLVLKEHNDNPYDSQAIRVYLPDGVSPVGYLPRCLAPEVRALRKLTHDWPRVRCMSSRTFHAIVQDASGQTVMRERRDALLRIESPWPESFRAFSDPQLRPMHPAAAWDVESGDRAFSPGSVVPYERRAFAGQ